MYSKPSFVFFRPEISMEENPPTFTSGEDPDVRALLEGAAGVLLPNYVAPWCYTRSIVKGCRSWLLRLDTQLGYCGKTRQAVLFRDLQVCHPESRIFESQESLLAEFQMKGIAWSFPFVLKGDTGSGGRSVFPIRTERDLLNGLPRLPPKEPLLIQKWVADGGRDLRVVVYGAKMLSCIRVGDGRFYNNVCRGGTIDHAACPDLQAKGQAAVRTFCSRAAIDIAGFDLMFPDDGDPVLIEVNFHFGRKGLGGTKGHRQHVREAVWEWRKRCLATFRSEPETVSISN